MDNLLVVISGPSGAGKSTVVKKLLARNNEKYKRIPTYTTRQKRVDEIDESQYYFITKEEYDNLDSQNLLISKNVVDGCYYGAKKIDINLSENFGKYFIIDMGASGAEELKKEYPNAIFIYLIPPTQERLIQQMGNRGIERLERSKQQLSKVKDTYDWLIINDNIKQTVSQVEIIMHIMKDYDKIKDKLGEKTLRFLYEKNFYRKENTLFLQNFYKTVDKNLNEIRRQRK